MGFGCLYLDAHGALPALQRLVRVAHLGHGHPTVENGLVVPRLGVVGAGVVGDGLLQRLALRVVEVELLLLCPQRRPTLSTAHTGVSVAWGGLNVTLAMPSRKCPLQNPGASSTASASDSMAS